MNSRLAITLNASLTRSLLHHNAGHRPDVDYRALKFSGYPRALNQYADPVAGYLPRIARRSITF
jgi:hypothetical protein